MSDNKKPDKPMPSQRSLLDSKTSAKQRREEKANRFIEAIRENAGLQDTHAEHAVRVATDTSMEKNL